MNALKKISADQMPTDRATDIVERLKARNVPIALIIDDGLAVIQAHVPSGQAARMLKPLGRKAVGQFYAMPRNMVVIDAIVSLSKAERMLAAGRTTA
ncbi:hypothetical protein NB311A_19687 [Nitrobacter sp. Nb-311A]|uniref:hypothetical protein n=1 Tax=Nitrobacter sp. Nb-311A TaxID=314253 RepID=UPI0000685F85|nr:hypothetical protein [Nitrobacter sp. Nb-311A]EAQ34826.1 hypothetical protein NB311A_19687 [Nitrobacter sp. Nb-311A]